MRAPPPFSNELLRDPFFWGTVILSESCSFKERGRAWTRIERGLNFHKLLRRTIGTRPLKSPNLWLNGCSSEDFLRQSPEMRISTESLLVRQSSQLQPGRWPDVNTPSTRIVEGFFPSKHSAVETERIKNGREQTPATKLHRTFEPATLSSVFSPGLGVVDPTDQGIPLKKGECPWPKRMLCAGFIVANKFLPIKKNL